MKRLYILAGANGSVPDEDVRRRYIRSKDNFVSVYAQLADCWLLYYNGGSEIALVAHGKGSLNIILHERYEAFMEDICQKKSND